MWWNERVQITGDMASIGVMLATLGAWLPPIAAMLTIVWTIIRISETRTVQKMIEKFRARSRN